MFMNRKWIAGLLALMLCFMAGCSKGASSDVPDYSIPEQLPTEEQTEPVFVPYTVYIHNPALAVFAKPSYDSRQVGLITDQGAYLITEEAVEKLDFGTATVWGKLDTMDGWINLEDAFANPETEGTTEVTESTEVTEPTEVTETTAPEETSYLFNIKNPCVSIHSGPGYGYTPVGSIEDKGTYTIVEEVEEHFTGGRYVTWGKLKSGSGWICLDDAGIDFGIAPPYRCTDCGRTDVSISRHGLCGACHEKADASAYGRCAVCGDALTYEEHEYNDGFVCDDCLICGWCGTPITIMDVAAFSSYICEDCYTDQYYCDLCGAGCFYSSTKDGLCADFYDYINSTAAHCVICGVVLHDGNTAYNGYGKCQDCYDATYVPELVCDVCGADCTYQGTTDGMCDACYNASQGKTAG